MINYNHAYHIISHIISHHHPAFLHLNASSSVSQHVQAVGHRGRVLAIPCHLATGEIGWLELLYLAPQTPDEIGRWTEGKQKAANHRKTIGKWWFNGI